MPAVTALVTPKLWVASIKKLCITDIIHMPRQHTSLDSNAIQKYGNKNQVPLVATRCPELLCRETYALLVSYYKQSKWESVQR